MRSLLSAAAVAASFVTVQAAIAAPSPSPSLDTVLVAPPGTDYVDYPNGLNFPEGNFTAPQWAALSGTDAPNVEATLHSDGFLGGYARAWRDSAHKHVLVEAVTAFAGGKGAGKWLAGNQPKETDAYYSRAISISGVASAVAGHYADPALPGYLDQAVFVKGNDYFLVSISGPADDLADIAATQTQRQFSVAPPNTVPPDQWPENATPPAARVDLAATAGRFAFVAVAAVLVVIVVVVAAVVLLSRRGPAVATPYGPMPPIAPTPQGVQMSGDGNYWWDGYAWKDASKEVPPGAQRSSDGYYWWDGRAWRPVPRSLS